MEHIWIAAVCRLETEQNGALGFVTGIQLSHIRQLEKVIDAAHGQTEMDAERDQKAPLRQHLLSAEALHRALICTQKLLALPVECLLRLTTAQRLQPSKQPLIRTGHQRQQPVNNIRKHGVVRRALDRQRAIRRCIFQNLLRQHRPKWRPIQLRESRVDHGCVKLLALRRRPCLKRLKQLLIHGVVSLK